MCVDGTCLPLRHYRQSCSVHQACHDYHSAVRHPRPIRLVIYFQSTRSYCRRCSSGCSSWVVVCRSMHCACFERQNSCRSRRSGRHCCVPSSFRYCGVGVCCREGRCGLPCLESWWKNRSYFTTTASSGKSLACLDLDSRCSCSVWCSYPDSG